MSLKKSMRWENIFLIIHQKGYKTYYQHYGHWRSVEVIMKYIAVNLLWPFVTVKLSSLSSMYKYHCNFLRDQFSFTCTRIFRDQQLHSARKATISYYIAKLYISNEKTLLLVTRRSNFCLLWPLSPTQAVLRNFRTGEGNISFYLVCWTIFFALIKFWRLRRLAVLLSCLGAKVYEVLMNLVTLDALSTRSFTNLVAALKSHFEQSNRIEKGKVLPRLQQI